MPRPKKIDATVSRHVRLPQSVAAKIDALLFSEVEGRVPYGAWQELVARLCEDWVARQGAEHVANHA